MSESKKFIWNGILIFFKKNLGFIDRKYIDQERFKIMH